MGDKTSCGTTTPSSCGTKKPCCWKTGIKGMLAGGIVAFIYLSVSWMFIPWHTATLSGFTDEAAVAQALQENAPESGIYILPHMKDMKQEPVVKAPFAFVSVKKEGVAMEGMTLQMVKQLLLCLALAGILTCMLKQAGGGCPVGFSMKAGLLVALMHNVPNYIWFQYPCGFTLVGMADDFIAVTLAGLVISKCVLKKGPCATA